MPAVRAYVELPRVDKALAESLRDAGVRAVAVPLFSQKLWASVLTLEEKMDEIKRIGEVEGVSKGISVGDLKPLEAEEWEAVKPYAGDFVLAPATGLPVRTLNAIRAPVYIYVQGGLPLEQYRALSQLEGIAGLVYIPAPSYREGAQFSVLDLAAISLLRSLDARELLIKVGEYMKPEEAERALRLGADGIVIEPPGDPLYENEEVVEFVRRYMGLRAGEGYAYLG